MLNSKYTHSIFAVTLASLCAWSTPALADASRIVQCTFGEGEKESSLTLGLPSGPKRPKSREIEIKAVPGQGEMRSAVAQFVSKSESAIGKPYVRLVFYVDAKTGFVTQIADNGHSITYPIDTSTLDTGEKNFGLCKNHSSLFKLWY